MNRESISKMAAAMQQVAENQKKSTDEGYSSMVSKATRDRIKKSVAQNKPPVVNPKYKATQSPNRNKTDDAVKEARFEIPETIQAAERTAFHGAAAGAHKAGKSHFNFAGKKYPVTMKKDTAKAIADDVKEANVDEISKKTLGSYIKKAGPDAVKQAAQAKRQSDAGDMADKDRDMYKHYAKSQRSMDKAANRQKGISKAVDKLTKEEVEESKNMALAKKLAKASASSEKGKAAVTLKKAPFDIPKASKNEEDEVVVNPKKETKKAKIGDNEVSAVESTVWPVYARIMEKRGEHYKSSAAAQEPNDASKSSKGAQDMLNTPKDVKDNPEASGDDVKKAANAGPSKKARTNDNKAGDSKVIPSATKA